MSIISDHKNAISIDKIREIVSDARFAPSSHNTQPWKVSISEDEIRIGYDEARQLTVGDPNKRELFISLGCFIETILLLSSDRGIAAEFIPSGNSATLVGKIKLKNAKLPKTHWEHEIKNRRSDRRYYANRHLAQGVIDKLTDLNIGEAKLFITEKDDELEFLASMTRESTLAIMGEQSFRDELSNWVRNNWTKKHDGMPGYTQGMPGPISLIAKFVVKRSKKVAVDQAKKDSKRVRHSSAVGLILIKQENYQSWIQAGMLYQRVCLESLKHNVKTSAVSAAVIYDKTAVRITKKINSSLIPVALIRFGYTKNTVRAVPRLSLEHFTIQS